MNTLIDVGCAMGSYAFEWLKGRDNMVYAFEPNSAFYAELKKQEKEHFKVFPYAVCDKDGEAWFCVNDNAVTSSLKPFADGFAPFYTVEKILVQTVRLDTFCRSTGIASIRLLKTDAQGSDLDVLIGLGDMLGQTHELIVEAFIEGYGDMYRGEQKKGDVCNFLFQRGFGLVGQRDDGNYTDLTFRRSGA